MTKKELVKKLREKANQPDNLHPLINEMSQLMREAADFIEESDWKPIKSPKELPTSDPILVTYDDARVINKKDRNLWGKEQKLKLRE